MRLYSTFLFLLAAAALLLAKSDGGPGLRIEVHTSNAPVEISGTDNGRVTINDSAKATVRNVEGSTVIEAEGPDETGPLKVHVPRGSSVEVVTSNGGIRVSGVAGTLRLTTSNGVITVADAGTAQIYAHTSNAKIEVGLPAGLNANLSARTSNAGIHADMEIVTRHLGETYLEGRIGNGGPALDLETSNSPIYLRNAGDRESVRSTFKSGVVK